MTRLLQGAMAVSEEAIRLKERGNQAFKDHDWPAAVLLYTQAIDLFDQEASFYTNRAQVSRLLVIEFAELLELIRLARPTLSWKILV